MIYNNTARGKVPLAAQAPVILPAILAADQLAKAIQLAAESAGCVIGEHVAAPRSAVQGHRTESVEAAIDFLVPPRDLSQFVQALDHHLMSLCPEYATHRYGGRIELPTVQAVPAGTVHQWRHIWKKSSRTSLGWSINRENLDGVLHQGLVGWRELDA